MIDSGCPDHPGCPDRHGSDAVYVVVDLDHLAGGVPFESPTRPSAGVLLGGLLWQLAVQPPVPWRRPLARALMGASSERLVELK